MVKSGVLTYLFLTKPAAYQPCLINFSQVAPEAVWKFSAIIYRAAPLPLKWYQQQEISPKYVTNKVFYCIIIKMKQGK